MTQKRIEIRTEDGTCPAYVFRPEKPAKKLQAVLFLMDGIGIRPALFEMGERMASAGYHVLLPDLFYRAGPYEPMDAKTVFSDPAQRAVLMSKFFSVISVEKTMRDVKSFLAQLDSEKDVIANKIGTTGYCMGGRMSLCAAGHFPDRIVAAAAYHPGNPANDAPDSPHLLASKMKARIYVGQAKDDQSFPEEQRVRLEKALTDARVEHAIEAYPCRHGWVPTDTPAHDPAGAERHWTTLLDLWKRTLKS